MYKINNVFNSAIESYMTSLTNYALRETDNICVICLEASDSHTICQTCKNSNVCEACLNNIDKCPLCKT